MRTLLILTLLLGATTVYAQSTPAALSTDPQQIRTLIQTTGCNAEVDAAAQTIASLQKQVNDLQKQLAAKDPPKAKK